MSVRSISPRDFTELAARGGKVELIDVRTPIEYREIHVQGARNLPLDQLDPVQVMAQRGDQEPLYVICRSGGRGKQACEKFLAAGYANVFNVEGGTLGCVEAGASVVRGKPMMSLERQVRIVAGSLVLIGTSLGFWVHLAFLGIPAFVGAGLIFAGVTDTCGMGMLLAKMPWNQIKDEPAACAAP